MSCSASSRSSLARPILSGGGAPSASLGSPGALRAVVMTGVFIALMALMSFGFGLILRSTAAAIAAFVGVVFVLPLVMHGISEPDLRYVPTNILTNSIMSTVNQEGREGCSEPLSPGDRVVADGHLRRDRPRRRRGAVPPARRLSLAGAEGRWVQIRIPEQRAEQVKRLARMVAREPFQKRSWAELGFFLASSALACTAVFLLAALGMAGLALTVVLVGVLVLAGDLRVARGLARWQRALARKMLGEEISEPEPLSPRPGLFAWLRASLGDRAAWRAVGYFVAKLPLTVFGVWFALSVWLEALSGIASPLLGRGAQARFGLFGRPFDPGNGGSPPGFATHVAVFVSGLVLLFVAPWTMRLVVYLDRGMMQLMLGPRAAASRVEKPRGVEIQDPPEPPARPSAVSSATSTTAPKPSWLLWRGVARAGSVGRSVGIIMPGPRLKDPGVVQKTSRTGVYPPKRTT